MKPPRAILLTRSVAENRRIAPLFDAKGMTVLSLPMIALHDLPVDSSIIPPSDHSFLVLLTSREATTRWLALRRDDARCRKIDVSGYLIVGEGSGEMIGRVEGEAPVLLTADSIEKLCGAVRRQRKTLLPAGGEKPLLYPCSSARRDEGVDAISGLGVEVIELPLYEPFIPPESASDFPHAIARLAPGDAILFFSPSAVAHFFELLQALESTEIDRNPKLDGLRMIAIGPTTAAALRAHGVADAETPARPDVREIAAMLAE